MYKLIAIDLDGTMLNSYGEVLNETKQSLNKAIEKGAEVIIASGRTIDSIMGIANEIGIKNYIIAGNGAVIYDLKKDEKIYERYIPKEKLIEIMNICDENNIFYNIYTNKTIVTTKLKYNALYYYKENLKKEMSKKTSLTIVEDIHQYIDFMPEDESILKIMICDEDETVFKSITRKLKTIEKMEVLDVSHMSRKVIKQGTEEINIEYFYTEVSMENVDKWNAIEFLIDKLNIKKDEVMTIGDNMNDKKMIEGAGLGVAMKHSTPLLTEVADYITDDNNNNGVGKAIDIFLN